MFSLIKDRFTFPKCCLITYEPMRLTSIRLIRYLELNVIHLKLSNGGCDWTHEQFLKTLRTSTHGGGSLKRNHLYSWRTGRLVGYGDVLRSYTGTQNEQHWAGTKESLSEITIKYSLAYEMTKILDSKSQLIMFITKSRK